MRTGLTLQVSEIPSVLNFYCRDEFHLKDLWLVFVLMKGKSHTVVFNLFPTGTTHPLKPPSPPIVLWCFVYQCLFIFAWLHAFSGLPLATKDTLWPRPVLCGGGRVGRPGNICPYLAAETIEVVKKLLCGMAPGVKKIHPALLKALGIVLVNEPIQCCLCDGDFTCGVADQAGGCRFQKRGPERVLQSWGIMSIATKVALCLCLCLLCSWAESQGLS